MLTRSRFRDAFVRTPRSSRKARARSRPAIEALETRLALSLGLSSAIEGPLSGSDSVVVAVSGAWTAASNANWLHTSSSGTGNGLATFSFDPNIFGTRTGTLTIAGATLTVTQAGTSYRAADPLTTLVATGLNAPRNVAVDSSGNVYIADTGDNAVKKWNAATGQVTTLVSSGLNAPRGVAVDPSSGDVYIADTGDAAIKKWSATTGQVTTVIADGFLVSVPGGIAVDAAGNVYFTKDGNSVVEWNAKTSGLSTVFFAGGFLSSVAVDVAGNIYTVDNGFNKLFEWNATTGQVSTLISSGLNAPYGVAVDGSGNVYIADSGNGAVKERNAVTGQVTALVSSGLSGPVGVAVDATGSVFITDSNTIKALPRAFVSDSAVNLPAGGGSIAADLLPVLPSTQSVAGAFAPSVTGSWLSTSGAVNGAADLVVTFTTTENTTGSARTALLTVLGQPINVFQSTSELVTNLNDSGTGSLREVMSNVIASANGAPYSDVIVIPQNLYTAPVAGQPDPNTIHLASALPAIPSNVNLTIRGAVPDGVDRVFSVSAQNKSRVFDVLPGAVLTVDNLTLTQGNVGGADDGGAVLNAGTLTLTNSAVTSSSARSGGGIANFGTLHLVDSLVSGDQATLLGAGIFSYKGTVTVDDSTLSNNTNTGTDTTTTLPLGGGGLFALGGSVSVISSTVSGNTVLFNSSRGLGGPALFSSGGGGIDVQNGTDLEITDSTVSGNTATLFGGGVLVQNASVTVTRSNLVRNTAHAGCGLANFGYGYAKSSYPVVNAHGKVIVTASTIADNTAPPPTSNIAFLFSGGTGIANLDAPLTIADSTISGNAGVGVNANGIYNAFEPDVAVYNSGVGTMTNTTVTNNPGGGIQEVGGGVLTITSSTVYGNVTISSIFFGTPNTDDILSGSAGIVTLANCIVGDYSGGGPNLVGVNLVQSGVAATTVINADPVLGALQDNGGPTLTRMPAYGSPAIGAGDAQAAIDAGLISDQRGFARVIDGKLDLGAVEKNTPAPIPPTDLVVSTLADTRDDDFSPGHLSLREALDIANARPGSDVITFAPGLAGTIGPLVFGPLIIQDDVQIVGPSTGQLSIDGGDTQIALEVTSSGPVEPTVVIQNLVITSFSIYGIENYGNLTLDHCGVTGGDGSPDVGGDAVKNAGTLSVADSAIFDNTNMTGIEGGGNISLSHSVITKNGFAGLYITGTASLDNCVITNNSLEGGILVEGGKLTVADSSIMSNDGNYGGIYNFQGTVTVTNSTIADNVTSQNGGGISNSGGTVTVTNSTIADNVAQRSGGGVYTGTFDRTSPGKTTLINDTIAGNSANTEAFFGNTASTGGGVLVDRGGTLIMGNTIIADNAGSQLWVFPDIHNPNYPAGVLQLDGPNLVQGGLAGFPGLISADPLLGPLHDNGGPTLTMALAPGSPAANAGDNSLIPAGITTDERGTGFPRIVRGVVDLGAYEAPDHPPTISTFQTAVTTVVGTTIVNTGLFNDPDGLDTVTLTTSLGKVLKFGNAWGWQYQPTDVSAGPITVTVTATDDGGLTATTSFTLTVTNVPPTAAITGMPGSGHSPEGTTINLGSSVTDPSPVETAAGFTYAWTVTKNGAAYASGSTAGFSFTPDDFGTYVVTLIATDKDGDASQPASATITVDKAPPIITAFNVPSTATEGSPVTLSAAAANPAGDDDPLTYHWVIAEPNGSDFVSVEPTPTLDFTPQQAGGYLVTLSVEDDDGESDLRITTMNVTAPVQNQTDLLVTNSGAPNPVIAGNDLTYTVTVSNDGQTDAQGASLTDAIPANTTFVSTTVPAGWTRTDSVAAGGTGALTFTDPTLAQGASASFTIVVHVSPSAPNNSPIRNTATAATTSDPNLGPNHTATATATVKTQADLVVTKTGPATIVAGQDITYQVSVYNAGPSDAQNVSLTDNTPPNTTSVSAQEDSGPTFPGTLPAGSTATFTFVDQVNSNTPSATIISNTAFAVTTTNDPNLGTHGTSSVNTTVSTEADLSTSFIGPSAATAGDPNGFDYTITVKNNGPSDNTGGFIVSDTLPPGLTFQSAQSTPGASVAGNTVSFTNTSGLAANATATITIHVTVGASVASGTQLQNSASVTTTGTTSNPSTNTSNSVTTAVQTQTDLKVTNTGAPNPVIAGNDLTYTVTASNNGLSDAQAVSLSDAIPANTTFVSATIPAGWARNDSVAAGGTGNLTFIDSTLAQGASASFTIVVQVNPSAANNSTISNTASVSTTTPDSNLGTNGTATASNTVNTQANLVVANTGPSTIIAGNNLTYSVTVSNNGPSDAQGVSLADAIPANTTFVSTTLPSGWTRTDSVATGGTGTLTFTDPALAQGASFTFTIVVQVSPSAPNNSTISSTATASTTTSDPNLATHGTSSVNTIVSTDADLSISLSGPSTATAGDPNGFDYAITVKNNGPSDNTGGFTVTDVLPIGLTFHATGSTVGASAIGQMVTFTNATGLASGAMQTIVLHVTLASSVVNGATLQDTASVASNGTNDPNSANNTSNTVTTTVQTQADLSVTDSGPMTAVAGDPNGFNYAIVVTNNGPADNVGGFTVTDVLPAGLTFQSSGSTAGAFAIGQTVTFTNPTGLANGASQTITLHVTLASSAVNGTTLQDSATVASNGTTDPNSANNTSKAVTTTVQTQADLSITDEGPVTAIAGDPNGPNYIIVVKNHGPSDNTGGFTITDLLPAGLMFQSTGSTAGASAIGQTVTFTNATGLANGASQSITLHVTLASSAVNGSTLQDSATVASNGTTDPNSANNTSNTVSTAVHTQADLSITNIGPSFAIAGDPTGFNDTIVVSNNGPSDNAGGFTVTDVLPSGLTFVSASSTPGASGNGQRVSYTNTTGLVSGGTQTFTIHVTLASSAAFGGTVQGSATVASNGTTDPNSMNNMSTASLIVVAPGVTVAGSTLYLVGGKGNDQAIITPIGAGNTGSTGIQLAGNLNGTSINNRTFSQAFTAIDFVGFGGNDNIQLATTLTISSVISEGDGNDNIHLGAGTNTVTAGNGNDSVGAGNGSNTVTLGNGNDNVTLGNGNNNVIVGNGNDNVQAGNGNNVIVEGNGNDDVQAGSGNDLVVGGLGKHTIKLGNGDDILIDGSVTLTQSGDSLRQVLNDWSVSAGTAVRHRLTVTYNASVPNALAAGAGRNWFFYTYPKTTSNKKPTDGLN